MQHLTQLVAHPIDDGLEVERSRYALLDAVDQRQCASPLLQLRRALGHGALQVLLRAHVGQRHRGLRGQHRQQVAVAVVEAAEGAFDVAVQVAQQLALRDQRRDEATALVDRLGSLGTMAQAHRARQVRGFEPGRDGLQQRGFALAPWKQRAGELEALGRFQDQQHPLGA
jgi:hypothetical protein